MNKKNKVLIFVMPLVAVFFLAAFVAPIDRVITSAHIQTGRFFFFLRGYDQAESFFLKAVEKLCSENKCSPRIVSDLRRLAWHRYYIDGNLSKGENVIKHAMRISEKNSEEMAFLYKDLGEILNGEAKHQESEEAFLESLRIYRSLEKVELQFDMALKMAIYYSHRALWEDAEKQLALAILFRNQKESSTLLSNEEKTEVCLLLGKIILHVVKDKNKAWEYHLAAYENAKYASLQKQVQAQIAIGSYYESDGQFAEAMQKYRIALNLCAEEEMQVEKDYLKHTMQGCLRKFSMEITSNRT